MKNKSILSAVYALITFFVLTSVSLYTEDYSMRWMVSLAVFILAMSFNLYSLLYLQKKKLNLIIINIPYFIFSGFYLISVLLINIFGEWLPNFFQREYYFSQKDFFVIHFFLLTAALSAVLTSFYSNGFIEKIEEETFSTGNQMKLKKFVLNIQEYPLSHELNKALSDLEEELRFSDPVSCSEVFSLDEKIDMELILLKDLLKNPENENSFEKINHILWLLKKRNELLLLSKQT